jgi:2-oxoglutarate dehydrogenase E2 component (dihydrolipoamide succinyltransferase)
MAIELKIPEVGESITEVQISEWLKSEGDEVKADENVAVIDSEKTTFELPAPKGGRLTKILRQAGDTVKVGEVIAELESDGAAAEAEPPEAKEERKPKREPKPKVEPKPETRRAEKLEKEKAPEAEEREGKGEPAAAENKEPEDREKKNPAAAEREEAKHEEKEEARKPAPESEDKTEEKEFPNPVGGEASKEPAADREEEIVPMTMLRRTVARRLVEAQRTMAMLTTFNEVDLSGVQALRKQHGEAFEKRYQVRLGLMSFFVKATIDALKQFPKLNAEVRDNDIVYRNYFDLGVAVATETGLVVPVLRRAERLSFAEVEKAIGDFAQRAHDGKLKPGDLEGGTFTITNGGVFGSLLSTPIINPPQTGILGMHTIQDRPVAVAGQVVIRPMMYVALTYDHRVVDGREAVLFVRRVKEATETPARMLVEI